MRLALLSFLLAAGVLCAGPEHSAGSLRVALLAGDEVQVDQLQARVDGAPSNILSVRGPSDDLMLLIVMDVSGDLSLVDPAREALIESMQQLPQNTFIGLLRAQDGLRVVADPAADRAPIAEALRALPVSGKAGLLSTVETAAQLADRIAAKSGIRLALLYVTDSNIYNYREDYTNPVVNGSDARDLSRRFPEGLVKEKTARLASQLAARQTPLFILHLDRRADRLNEAYQTGLLELAAVTGGATEICRTQGEVPAAVQKMLGMIQSHYSVEVQMRKMTSRQVVVSLEAPGMSLRYRSRFQLRDP
ncbi:MAG: hypothetical protein JJE04_04570 [Acidobacteriia bacterium]|nr:hypothetical protein [Terriglobia bacterium]